VFILFIEAGISGKASFSGEKDLLPGILWGGKNKKRGNFLQKNNHVNSNKII